MIGLSASVAGTGPAPAGTPPEAPLVSVLIINYNGARDTARCLRSLAHTTGVTFETIVLDNASRDGSAQRIAEEFPAVRVVRLRRNVGFGRANGRGAQLARGRYLAFLNNDTVVEPGWLEALVQPLASDPQIAAACSTLLLLEEPHLYNGRGGKMSRLGFACEEDYRHPVATSPARPLWSDTLLPTGAAMLMRACDFAAMGGFDPAMFMYHEDVDLGWRLWLAGRRVVVVAASRVYHDGSATTGRTRPARWKIRMGHQHAVRSMLKCYEWHNVGRSIRGNLALCRREYGVGMVAAILAWNLWHLPSALRARRAIQRARRVSDDWLVRRGLIWDQDVPAPPPVVHFGHRAPPAPRVVSHLLLPGLRSAWTRLTDGWHAVELFEDGWARWTNGDARCFLQTTPGTTGRLRIAARLPVAAVRPRQLRLECNGALVEHELATGWQECQLPVAADHAGRLAVRILSTPWKPSEIEGTTDTPSASDPVPRPRPGNRPKSKARPTPVRSAARCARSSFYPMQPRPRRSRRLFLSCWRLLRGWWRRCTPRWPVWRRRLGWRPR